MRPAEEDGVPSLPNGDGGLATAKYCVCGRRCCWPQDGLRPETAAEGARRERVAARENLEGACRPLQPTIHFLEIYTNMFLYSQNEVGRRDSDVELEN